MERRTQSSQSSNASECDRCVLKSHELTANSCTSYLALWEGSSNVSAPLQRPEFDVNLRRSASTDVTRGKVRVPMKKGVETGKRTVLRCGRLLLSVLLLFPSTALGQAQVLAKPDPATIQPFQMHVPDRVLIDLRHRLAETKWPDQLPGTTWEYGGDIKRVRELADYWENNYDWRAQEAKINRFRQFTTEIDGQQIYFIHERSPRPDAVPLMLIHGWPGSIVEFFALIGPLTHPNDSHSPAFDVVIPSLPGFGFSGPTTTRGWGPERMAKAMVVLMDRLGYSRYGIQGGDWGSLIARDMAYQAPAHVIGLHLNLITADPPNPEAVKQMSDAERKRFLFFSREESSFFFLQASEPQTLAYALTDSPAGWLAWMTAKFQLLTDNNGDFLTTVDRDTFLTNVTVYWVTDTVGSAMRIYRENRLTGEEAARTPRLETPVAYADFPKEVAVPPFRWITLTYNVVQRTEMPRGGHFAALEQPDLLLDDIRKFFTKVGQK
jgi:pimeloyl-ACP methyl ester carboxylesterase